MEGEAISATIGILVQNLITISKDEISLIRGLEKNAEKLKGTLATIQTTLDDAHKKFVTNDAAVKRWLGELEAVAFDADNVVDELNYKRISKEMKSIRSEKKMAASCCPSFFSGYIRQRQIALTIMDINSRFETIDKKATEHGLERRLADAPVAPDAATRETSSLAVDPIFIGRDSDVLEIVEVLITPREEAVSILPIVGMGGLGKTTLARKVFNHEKVKTYFGKHIWVHVSPSFDAVELLKKILTNLTGKKVEGHEITEVLLRKLREALEGKMYVLVLDDVWNQDREKWEDFINSWLGITSTKGNCILVTTRNMDVSSIVDTLGIRPLKGLSKEECWSIIKEKVFKGGHTPQGFEAIGKCIAGRCQGLPLAANVVGGVLCGKALDDWHKIEQNWLSDVREGENNISKILGLSYDHLSSPSLKKCFAYCSVFPKGSKIEREDLIQLWMAERFLQPSPTSDTEDVGTKVVDLLVQSSLLHVVKRDTYNNIESCGMHDLVHDVACSVLGFSKLNNNSSDGSYRARYLFCESDGDNSSLIMKEQSKWLRTLVYIGDRDIIFSEFKSLHVLILEGDIGELPDTIRELIHLRFLNISKTKIETLPDSTGELYHLQTFKACDKYFSRLKKLPITFKYLSNLRHLHLHRDTELPPHIGMISSLQTLRYFKVRDEEGYRIVELGSLQNLKGELCIYNLEKVSDEDESKKACLFQKSSIVKLELRWDGSSDGEINDESVLRGLQPHSNLKILIIVGFKGASFPSWTSKMEGLENLMEIKLDRCSECTEIPMLGHLPYLKSVYLYGLKNVRSISSSFYGVNNCSSNNVFQALETLELVEMSKLEEWVEAGIPNGAEVKVFPCLKILKIKKCDKLRELPILETLNSLEELEIINCKSLESIPTLGHFSRLKSIYLSDLENVKSISSSFYGIDKCSSNNVFPTLERLEFRMSNLEEWVEAEIPNGAEVKVFPCLKILEINNCNKLKSAPTTFPCLEQLEIDGMDSGVPLANICGIKLTSLVQLKITNVDEMASLPDWLFRNNQNLLVLEIRGCKELRELPDGVETLNSLEVLKVEDCSNLESIPFSSGRQSQGCTLLRELSIGSRTGINVPCALLEWCASSIKKLQLLGRVTNMPMVIESTLKMPHLAELVMDSVPKFIISCPTEGGSLRSLKSLDFSAGESWDSVSFNNAVDGILRMGAPSLQYLVLKGNEDWESLPDQLQHLTALEYLDLSGFGIEELPEWFGNLSSLQRLEVWYCRKLKRQPFVEVMQRLTNLSVLGINYCPLFEEGGGIEQQIDVPTLRVNTLYLRYDGNLMD